ncbi:hypothetical protein HRbin19_00145 [bacterium HR19]|nr:hypothetical protein HRbin19_00145 [bacterium HR19]
MDFFLSLFPLIVIFILFYFIVIRPQTRVEAKRKEFIKNLKKGDIVFLSSGIVGKVSEIYQKTVSLEVSKDVKIRVLKDFIQGPFSEKDEPQEKQAEKKE